MLKNKDMICISASDWLKPWGSKQHLMSRLSEYNRVLYVEYQASMLDFIKYPGYFIKRLGNLNKLQKLSRNLYVYTPVLLLPFGYYFNCINILNQRILKKHLLKIIKGLGFEDIILWIYPSSSLALIGNMTERLSVYHCIASFSDEKKNPLRKRMIQRLENDMARRVNIIFTLTKTLCGRFKKINPNTFYFPSAVDIGHYENILSGNTQEPQDMILVKKPRIGIIGYLNGNIMDIGLIEYLADYKKDWSIVMIGPVFKGWGKMKKLKKKNNIYFLGEKKPEDIPLYLKYIDVCLIPYLKTRFLNEVSPMKLYEYLAMGKPVVSTSFSDELLGLENILSIADSRSSFAQLVERALNGCGEDMVLNRKKLAGENSWQNRLNFLSDKIEACWRVKQKGQ